MIKKTALLLILFGISTCLVAQDATYKEQYRPQFHFSPAINWMNDPNGMVYYDGEYHLFYQYNPFGDKWGHMSWGHAVSTDLVHWEHLPVALYEENNVMIFSGSAVVDHQNTTGFGTIDNPPMVAIYTGHHTDQKRQDQRLAYSLDKGRTWKKYEGNPVLDEQMADFRDPKVIWHEESEQWIMVLAIPLEFKVAFYGSDDLKNWNKLSEFGPSGAVGGIWECPLLFEVPVDGTDETKWVLQVDLNPGGPAGGSGSQYFVGDFDGITFVQDPTSAGRTLWADHGPDFYAVHSFENVTTDDGNHIWMAWMNNWDYAQDIPTSPWRSSMTIPREVGLKQYADGIYLTQQPIKELRKLRSAHRVFSPFTISKNDRWKPDEWRQSLSFEMIIELDVNEATETGLTFKNSSGEEIQITYLSATKELQFDRSDSGETDFNEKFSKRHSVSVIPENGSLKLHLFIDASSIEIFANEGRISITERVFPEAKPFDLSIFSKGGERMVTRLEVWNLASIW